MSLDLSKLAVVTPETVRKQAQQVYSLIDELEQHVFQEYNVGPIPEPEGQPPSITEIDVTALENRDLGALHLQYVGYSVFLNDRLIKLTCLEKAAKQNLKEVVAQLKTKLRAAGTKQTELTENIEQHAIYREYNEEALKLAFMKEIVEGKYKGYKEMAAGLSRNIALRELEFEQQRRADNVQKSTGHRKRRPFGAGKR